VNVPWTVPEPGQPADPNVTFLDPDQLTAVSHSLAAASRSDWMTMDERVLGQLPPRGNGTGDPASIPREVRVRSLYDMTCMKDSAAMDQLLSCTRTGQEIRFTEPGAMTLRIADRDALLIQASPPERTTVLIRDPQTVTFWRTIFDVMWSHAMPLPGSPS